MTTLGLSKGFHEGNDITDCIPGLSVLVSANLPPGTSEMSPENTSKQAIYQITGPKQDQERGQLMLQLDTLGWLKWKSTEGKHS